MFFKAIRSKSSSKSTKQSVSRITSSDAHSHSSEHSQMNRMQSKGHATTAISSVEAEAGDGKSNDFQKFLERARKEAEREEKQKMKELKEAERRRHEANMSPWASRM